MKNANSAMTTISLNISKELKSKIDIYTIYNFHKTGKKITMTDIILDGVELYFKKQEDCRTEEWAESCITNLNTALDEEEENIVRKTCRELRVTQYELAAIIGVHKETIGNWATGRVRTPKWAIKMFSLIKEQKKLK